jgi:hypothetical protein
MNYHHKQIGWIVIAIILPIIVVMLAATAGLPDYGPMLLTVLIMLAAVALFYCLTISVNSRALQFSFGIGLIRRTIKFEEMESAKQVKNPWYCGWGIRWFGKGWLYNVSGLDAVELQLKNGKLIRLGTDEPEALLRAINANIGMRA